MACDAALLTEIKFFQPLAREDRAALANVIDCLQLNAGEMLFHAGDPGDALFFVRSGTIELYVEDTTGNKVVLASAKPGTMFGELSLLDCGPRTATAAAAAPSELLVLHRSDLLALLQKRPDAALHMLAAMSTMTRKADELLRIRVPRNVNEEVEEKLTPVQKAAGWLTRSGGSLYFLTFNVTWVTVYVVVNILPGAFDPYPFDFLKVLVGLEALFLALFVLINQSRMTEKDRVRGNIEYEINVTAELEVTHLHEKVDRLYETVQERFLRLEKAVTG